MYVCIYRVESSDESSSSGDDQANIINTPSKVLFSPNLRGGETKNLEPLRRPQLPVSNSEDGDEDDDVEEFNPYLFMSQLPDHRLARVPGKICLPPKASEFAGLHTLVLDLDETLVHCTVDPVPNADLVFPVNFNGSSYQVYVRKRPYLDEFLEAVSKQFEVVLFTASQKLYADTLLNLLDPDRKFIHHRLFREACLYVQGNFLKDLTVLDRDLKTVRNDNNVLYYFLFIILNVEY